MDTQDVADHELAAARARRIHDGLRFVHGDRQRFLAEHMAAGLDGRPGVGAVCLRVGVDADHVGRGRGEGLVVIAELGHPAEL